jgi:hypothetical protein
MGGLEIGLGVLMRDYSFLREVPGVFVGYGFVK